MPLSGFGMGEMILIAMLVLIVFGPKRLPEITRTIGKGVREFKKGMNEIQRELEAADREERWSAPKPAAKPSEPTIAPPGIAGAAGAAVAGTATADATSPEEVSTDEGPTTAATSDAGTTEEDDASADSPEGTESVSATEEPAIGSHQDPPTPRPYVDPAAEFVDPWATDSSKPSMPRKPAPTPPPETDPPLG